MGIAIRVAFQAVAVLGAFQREGLASAAETLQQKQPAAGGPAVNNANKAPIPADVQKAIDEFQVQLEKDLAVQPLRYQFQAGDVAPSSDDVTKFRNAYLQFVAAPKFATTRGSAAGALDDATRRQASLKTMQYIALKYVNPRPDQPPRAGWLGQREWLPGQSHSDNTEWDRLCWKYRQPDGAGGRR